MGDIGLLGTKVQGADGYHVFIGGGFGKNQAVGRQVFSGVSATEIPRTLETMLRVYLKKRDGRETFQQFTVRHDLNALQVMFTNGE
jgi:ferredoxin-nitrite reductase